MATRRTEKKRAALPDSVEDKTNIGLRNGGGGETSITIEEPVFEDPAPPTPASEPDPEFVAKGTDPEPAPVADTDLIRVRGIGSTTSYVLAEVNTRHPGGEAVIRGGEEKDVARTMRVMEAVYDGRLEIVTP